uniref:FZ domain-containing protein n=1 Tax=Wuchereria bancrofti TaxID=6293 RepID=A0AAF5PL03_WUCBA
MTSTGQLPVSFSIFHLALYYGDVLAKQQVKDPQCLWTSRSPCTVTCVSRGLSSVYSQQWQRFICNSMDKLNNNFSTSIAKFRFCSHMTPLCLSDERFSVAFQNYFFLAVFLVFILLIFLPNMMILGVHYTQVWVRSSSAQKSTFNQLQGT